jgi:hypothetical protein
VLEDTVATRRLRGATAVVREGADGTVIISVNDRLFAARLYPKDHSHIDPGAVGEHKRLDGVFEWIAAQQRDRGAARLTNPEITVREKQRIHAGSAPRIPASPAQ